MASVSIQTNDISSVSMAHEMKEFINIIKTEL